MGTTLEKLEVVIEGTVKPYKKAVNEAKAETKKMTDSINQEIDRIKSPFEGTKMDAAMGKIRSLQKAIRGAVSDYREKAGFAPEGFGNAVRNAVSQKVKDFQVDAGIKEYTDEYNQLVTDIERAEKAVERLKQKERDMEAAGVKHQSDEFKTLTNQIKAAERRVEGYNAKRLRLQGTGKDVQFTGVKNAAGSVVSKAFGGMKSVLSGVASSIKNAGGAFAALIQKFRSGIPLFGRLNKSVRQGTSAFGGGIKNILKYTLGIRSLFVLANKLRSALVSGMQNLVQYSDKTNSSMSTLMSGLTQLKNSLATAFAPILNAVAPILDVMIQKISQAVSAIGMLFATLSGQTTFTRAKKINQNYADSLNNTASGASNANKESKKFQRTLLGFDQINKLDDKSDSSSNGVSPADMFEEVSIPNKVKEFADQLKAAFGSGDWKTLGTLLGNKVNEIVDSINWKGAGQKIGRGLNGAVQTAYYFLKATDFQNLGKRVAELITGSLSEIDGEYIGRLLVRRVTARLDFFIGAVTNLDWKLVGKTIGDAIKGVFNEWQEWIAGVNWSQLAHDLYQAVKDLFTGLDFAGIAQGFFKLLGSALGAAGSLIGTLLGDIGKDISGYFADGFFQGLLNAIKGIGTWIYKNIVVPFIDGFKEGFGIHSPSTVMAEQGGYIIDGLLKGLKDKIGNVLAWFKELPGRIKDALGNAKDWLVEKGRGAIEGLKNGYEAVKDSALLSKCRALKSEVFEAVGDMAGKVKTKGEDIISGIKQGYENNKNQIKTAVSGLPGLISSGVGNLFSIGRSAISSFANGFASVHIPTPHISWDWNEVRLGKLNFSVPKFKLNWYAAGGFPENGEMFVAREAGPEMVGRMGRKNTVANNEQIVEGIRAGVFEAVLDAFHASGILNRDSSERSVVLEFTLMAGPETLYKVVRKGKEQYDGRFLVTDSI